MSKSDAEQLQPWSVNWPMAFYIALKETAHFRSEPGAPVTMKNIAMDAALSGDTELREEYDRQVRRLTRRPKEE